jgi:hypothetical protein
MGCCGNKGVGMSDLFQKLSSYNIFNNLFPGTVFVVLAAAVTPFDLRQEDIVIGLFVYYFIGLIISRIGSIAIEPLLKHLKVVRFADYSEFVKASQRDSRIEVLSETNNMYRTLCSMIVCVGALNIYGWASGCWSAIRYWGLGALVCGLLVLFCLAYSKQTRYIVKRVRAVNEKGADDG